jgi:hypothetical protein
VFFFKYYKNFLLFPTAKPEAPIDLNASTIYYNSIELEWKPGGISDIAYYVVKYRDDENKKQNFYSYYYYDYQQDDDIDNSNNIDENFFVSNNNIDDENDLLYSYENTTNTKYRIQAKLKPFNHYKFQVIAVNSLGESKQSGFIRVRTAAASKIDILVVFWETKLLFFCFRTRFCTKYPLHVSRKLDFYNQM